MYLTWPHITASGQQWNWWLLAGVVLGVQGWIRKRQLERSGRLEQLGWLAGIVTFAAVALVGFFVVYSTASLPANTAYEIRRGDRHALSPTRTATAFSSRTSTARSPTCRSSCSTPTGRNFCRAATEGAPSLPFHRPAGRGDDVDLGYAGPIAISEPERQGLQFPRQAQSQRRSFVHAAGAGSPAPAPLSPRSWRRHQRRQQGASGRPARIGPQDGRSAYAWSCCRRHCVMIPPLTSQ